MKESKEKYYRLIKAFFDKLGTEGDVDGWKKLLSPEITVYTPFVPEGEPRKFTGLNEIETRFGAARRPMQMLTFYDLDIFGSEDASRWVATCKSKGVLVDGREYQNEYCWLFHTSGELITHWSEYYDPRELAKVR